MRRNPPRVSPSCTRVSGPTDPMMRARPLASARTTTQRRATEVTHLPLVRARGAGAFAVVRDVVAVALPREFRDAATVGAVRFGAAFATAFAGGFAFARAGVVVAFGDATAVRRSSATRVGVVRAGGSSAGGAVATLGVGADGGGGVTPGVGDRRITEGGGSHGSRERALSTTVVFSNASSAAANESAVPVDPTATVVESSAAETADGCAEESTIATVEAESTPTTPVETSWFAVAVSPEDGGESTGSAITVSPVRATAVVSTAGSSTTGFGSGSSSRMRNAPTARLRNAATPRPFHKYGGIGAFTGAVPHHLQAPTLSG